MFRLTGRTLIATSSVMLARSLAKCRLPFRRTYTSEGLGYKAHGNPSEVLSLQKQTVASPEAAQVLVDFLAVCQQDPVSKYSGFAHYLDVKLRQSHSRLRSIRRISIRYRANIPSSHLCLQ